MSNQIHRLGDARTCGAETVAPLDDTETYRIPEQGYPPTVYAGDKEVAVTGEICDHGGGALTAATNHVYVNNKLVVNVGDSASADGLCNSDAHCSPDASSGLSSVHVGDP